MKREPNPEIVKAAMDEFWTQLRSIEEYKNLTGYEMARKLAINSTHINGETPAFKSIIEEGACPNYGLFSRMLRDYFGINTGSDKYVPTVYRDLLKELYDCEIWNETEKMLLKNISAKLSEIIELLKK